MTLSVQEFKAAMLREAAARGAPPPSPVVDVLAPWTVSRDSTRRVLVASVDVGGGARLAVEAETMDALRAVVSGLRGQTLVVP